MNYDNMQVMNVWNSRPGHVITTEAPGGGGAGLRSTASETTRLEVRAVKRYDLFTDPTSCAFIGLLICNNTVVTVC